MRKIRLSDTDLELFDIEIGPTDYLFYQRHKDAFKTMWREQGKPFWTRFSITFRSFTVKHGIIKQMNIDSPKFQNLLDQAFIFIHEQFVDGRESTAKNFIDDVARLAQNQDKFPGLDSKSFSKDPFFSRETRELFRKFFGPPDQKSSYLKVYILCPVYLRFGGSVCRCLIRWMEAPTMDDPKDDSYWIPPQPNIVEKCRDEIVETTMCSACVDECGSKFLNEKIMGVKNGPVSLKYWTLGDPRFNDSENPLFSPHLNPDDDWRDVLTVELFKDFYNYARFTYGVEEEKCRECQRLKKKPDKFITVCKASKARKKKSQTKEKEELIKDLKEVRERIDELEDEDLIEDYELKIEDIIKDKPRVREALEEADRKEKLEKLHAEHMRLEEEKARFIREKLKQQKEREQKEKELIQKQREEREKELRGETAKKKKKSKKQKRDNSEEGKGEQSGIEGENENASENNDNETVTKDTADELDDRDSSTDRSSTDRSSMDRDRRDSSVENVPDTGSFENDSNETAGDTDNTTVTVDDTKNDTEEIVEDTKESTDDIKESTKESIEDNALSEKDNTDLNDSSVEDNKDDLDKEDNAEKVGKDGLKEETEDVRVLMANKSYVAGFKVLKIEDLDNGLYEVNISAACLKSDEEESSYKSVMEAKLESQEMNNFILSANLLKTKIAGMPERLEWWEGRGFAATVINYEKEEKEHSKNWTHFTLKINGYDEEMIKRIMIKMLVYVSKRKNRTCYGWNMEVDDVVACILPEKAEDIQDLSISLSKGFRFEDRLTEFEKKSLYKHFPTLNFDKVLAGIEKGTVPKSLEKKGGHEKLRKIIDAVADKEVIAGDLPKVDVEKLCKKLNKTEVTKADILWEQLIRKPENFEIFVLLSREKVLVGSGWWDFGMRSMDIRVYNETKNPAKKICPVCKIIGGDCSCEQFTDFDPKAVAFLESFNFTNIKILGFLADLGTGEHVNEHGLFMKREPLEKPDKREKKAKSKAAKRREKRIELSEVPPKFLEAGIEADKATITIPSRDEEPLMGKVPIPVDDKLEKLAPVPGIQNSLNFTFQNGKKEQTITVTIGAYMSEDKINEIQEKKDLQKILEEEVKRKNAQAVPALTNSDKKEKKKKKKSKDKSPEKTVKPDAEDGTKKEKKAEVAARFLKEIFVDEQKMKSMTKTIHTQMGLSSKKEVEKQVKKPEEPAPKPVEPHECQCPNHVFINEQLAKGPPNILSQEEIDDITHEFTKIAAESEFDMETARRHFAEELMDLIDNKKTASRHREAEKKRQEELETAWAKKELNNLLANASDDQRDEFHRTVASLQEAVNQAGWGKDADVGAKGASPKKSKKKENRKPDKNFFRGEEKKPEVKNPEVESSFVDKIPDEDHKGDRNRNKINGGNKGGARGKKRKSQDEATDKDEKENGELETSSGKGGSSDEKEMAKMENLKVCGSCGKVEPTRKAFKKCQKCKDEGVLEVRYYCSRECQVDDWKKKHKMEHKDGLLG